MVFRRLLYFIFLSLFGFAHVHGQSRISGYVLDDKKEGVESVVVSCGVHMAQTTKKGYYELEVCADEQYVQISVPKGYLVKNEGTVPIFFQKMDVNKKVYNFHLIENQKDDINHVFFAQTDVQAASEAEYDLYREHIVSDMHATIRQYTSEDVFGLDLGDIVGDKPDLFPYYLQSMKSLPMPFFRAIGNHDMAYWGRSHETSERHFNKHFGPTVYSFNKGNTHYIVLNNNFFIGREYFYMGYIDEKTFKWLERDLSYVSKDQLLFLILHIPTRQGENNSSFTYNYSNIGGQTVNASALYDVLSPYNTHILSGHMHCNLNVVHKENLFEHVTAAASGTWWQADICTDGTPSGYAVFEVSGNEVEWYYKSAGYDRSHQLRAYYDEETNCVIANVWNYDPKWKVEWLENGIDKGSMEQYVGVDPLAKELFSDKRKLKYDWISPSSTKHLFRTTAINADYDIEIRITDRFGKVYTQSLSKKR
ncbi:serine/threonine protein phosphatase [Sphingobacterium olei]|uniref:Serine/threonine protein phosphatase n=1 Tax=Sphingobacterium olei TaxID=2571155 RepID=A0A4U0P3W4_9SPHI|nr:calcineurin-like phosphoesterase family protein [Sphingobacterium olei]TJZ61919.1 serine/threonine protein phosphatase [Sphingobacterium olei]